MRLGLVSGKRGRRRLRTALRHGPRLRRRGLGARTPRVRPSHARVRLARSCRRPKTSATARRRLRWAGAGFPDWRTAKQAFRSRTASSRRRRTLPRHASRQACRHRRWSISTRRLQAMCSNAGWDGCRWGRSCSTGSTPDFARGIAPMRTARSSWRALRRTGTALPGCIRCRYARSPRS